MPLDEAIGATSDIARAELRTEWVVHDVFYDCNAMGDRLRSAFAQHLLARINAFVTASPADATVRTLYVRHPADDSYWMDFALPFPDAATDAYDTHVRYVTTNNDAVTRRSLHETILRVLERHAPDLADQMLTDPIDGSARFATLVGEHVEEISQRARSIHNVVEASDWRID
jgi:hypothetical protein